MRSLTMALVDENGDEFTENQDFPPIYTSEDERDLTPGQSENQKDKLLVESKPAEFRLLQNDEDLDSIVTKKPKMAVSASLVSYTIDDDDDDQAEITEEDDSINDEPEKPELVQYSINVEQDTSSSHLESEENMILDHSSQLTLIQNFKQQQVNQPIHVPSQEELFAPQIPEIETKDVPPVDAATTESAYDRSQIKKLLEHVELPPEPPGHCPMKLQERVDREVHRMRLEIEYDPNRAIQDNKAFRNPSIYEKLIAFLNIDEKGTNFPTEVYNPYRWSPHSYYDELARVQNREIDRIMKLQKEQRKLEQNTGDASGKAGGGALSSGLTKTTSQPTLTSSGNSVSTGFTDGFSGFQDEPKKRSKWDTGIPESTTATEEALADTAAPIGPAVGGLVKQT